MKKRFLFSMRRIGMIPVVLFFLSTMATPKPAHAMTSVNCDVYVFGTTPAGISAAISAAQNGKSVYISSPEKIVGGLPASGLTNTDFRTYESLSGFWRRFMDAVVDYYRSEYGPLSDQMEDCKFGGTFEPKVAELIFNQFISQEPNITLLVEHDLLSATTTTLGDGKQRIQSVLISDQSNGSQININAEVFIDASYEGDLLYQAGIPFTTTLEAQSQYGESLANSSALNENQVFNFRVTLSQDPNNSVPIPMPPGYTRDDFLPLINAIVQSQVKTLDEITRGPIRPLPNLKADFNDKQNSPQSFRIFDTIDWITPGSAATRQTIWSQGYYQALGVLYTILNDSAIASSSNGQKIRNELLPWGLPADEFTEYGHFPPRIYVRQGRRMLGEYIYQQQDLELDNNSLRRVARADAIAIGDYPATCHGTHESNSGDTLGVINNTHRPFPTRPHQIPYGVIIAPNWANFLAPGPVSASHVGFQSLRLEPVWSALGQAAGIAAATALDEGTSVQDADLTLIQTKLHDAKACTFYVSDVKPDMACFRAVQFFGNQGFFQDLYSASANGDRGSAFPGDNQWYYAYQNHDIKPNRLMDAALMSDWLTKYDALNLPNKADTLLIQNESLERGMFLRRLLNEEPDLSSVTRLNPASVSASYSHTLKAWGLSDPLTWSIEQGTLPPGLTLQNGIIQGTPTQSGLYSFKLTVCDAQSQCMTREVLIEVQELTTVFAHSDTFVRTDSPSVNYNTDTELEVKHVEQQPFHRETLLQFDLQNYADTANEAKLYLTPSYLSSEADLMVIRVALMSDSFDATYSASNITWNTYQPDYANVESVHYADDYSVNSTIAIDITPLVAETLANDPNKMLTLEISSLSVGPGFLIRFHSTNQSSSQRRPQLEISSGATLYSDYYHWRLNQPWAQSDAGYFYDDHDADGRPNGLEYLIGTNPLLPQFQTEDLVQFNNSVGPSLYAVRYTQRKQSSGYSLALEHSLDLNFWDTPQAPAVFNVVDNDIHGDGLYEQVECQMPAASRAFFRLKIETP